MAGPPLEPAELFQCRKCCSFMMSVEGFRSHQGSCGGCPWTDNGDLCLSKAKVNRVNVGNDEDEEMVIGAECTDEDDDDPHAQQMIPEPVPVKFPTARVVLKRLSSSEVAKFKPVNDGGGGGGEDDGRDKPGRQSNWNWSHQVPDPDIFSLPPRRSSLIAMKSIREMTSGRAPEEKDQNNHGKNRREPWTDREAFQMDEDDGDDDSVDEEVEPEPCRTQSKRQNVKSLRASNGTAGRASQTKTDILMIQCDKCTALYRCRIKLARHIKSVHQTENKGNIVTCPICSRMMPKSFSHTHLQHHSDAEAVEDEFNLWNEWPKSSVKRKMRFSCKYCLLPTSSHDSFLAHMEEKHPDRGQFYKWQCTDCPGPAAEFDSIKLLSTHIRNSHAQEYFGPFTLQWIASKDSIEPESANRRGFKTKDKPYDTITCLKKNSDKNPYPCPMTNCNARLKSVAFLKSHFTLHLQNNPFVCPVPGCGVRCDAKCHLDRHMRHHTGELQVKCPKCGLSLARKDKLLTHKCTTITHVNYQSRYGHVRLQRIAEVKSEVLPNMKSNLDTTNHKPRPNLRSIYLSDPVFIKVCEENPGFKELLFGKNAVDRVRCSRMFKCRKCNIGFNVKKSFEKHRGLCRGIKTKTENGKFEVGDGSTKLGNEDNFQLKCGCGICGDYFDTRAQLKSHIKDEHATEQIFKCSECGKELCNSTSLDRHWFLVHGVVKEKKPVSGNKKATKNKRQPRSNRNKKKKTNYDSDSEDEESGNGFQQEGNRSIPSTSATATLVKVEPELIIDADEDCHIPKMVKLDPDRPEFAFKVEGNLKLEESPEFHETDMAILGV